MGLLVYRSQGADSFERERRYCSGTDGADEDIEHMEESS